MFVVGCGGLKVGIVCLDASMEHEKIIMSQLVGLKLSLIGAIFTKMVTKFEF